MHINEALDISNKKLTYAINSIFGKFHEYVGSLVKVVKSLQETWSIVLQKSISFLKC